MAEFEMVDQKARLSEAVLKLKLLEDEKKQSTHEYTTQINEQKELVYAIAGEIRKGESSHPLFEGVESNPDAEDDLNNPADVEVVQQIGGESVDPETGELNRKDAGGNRLPECYGEYRENFNDCKECCVEEGCWAATQRKNNENEDSGETKKEEGICPEGYTVMNETCVTCQYFATCGLPEEGEEL